MNYDKSHFAKEEMLKQLAYYERTENELIENLYEVLGDNFDGLLDKINVLYEQLNVDTATWGLDIWESNLDIENSEKLSFEERRAIIKSKLRAKGKVSTESLRVAIQDYYKGKVNVYFNHKLLFEIPMEGDSGYVLEKVIATINKMKPAHLGMDIQLYMEPIESIFYIGAFNQVGEEITIYPKPVYDPVLNTEVYFSVAYAGIAENVTIDSTYQPDDIYTSLKVNNLGNLMNQLEQVVLYSNRGGEED